MKWFFSLLLCFQLSALPWSDKRQEFLVQKVEASCHEKQTLVFAYGSLLDRDSAARHLSPSTLETYRPAIAFGVKRIFDRHVPISVQMGELPKGQTAMLNMRKTGNLNQIVNGVLFEVGKEEFLKLAEREIGYDIVPVPVLSWDEALNSSEPKILIAYTFSALDTNYTRSDIDPYPPYAKMCKEAAATHGPEFLNLWIETSYLSDEITPFSKWEAKSSSQKHPCIF